MELKILAIDTSNYPMSIALVPDYLRLTEAEAQWQKQHPGQTAQEYVHEV